MLAHLACLLHFSISDPRHWGQLDGWEGTPRLHEERRKTPALPSLGCGMAHIMPWTLSASSVKGGHDWHPRAVVRIGHSLTSH